MEDGTPTQNGRWVVRFPHGCVRRVCLYVKPFTLGNIALSSTWIFGCLPRELLRGRCGISERGPHKRPLRIECAMQTRSPNPPMGLTQLCPIDAPRPLRILGVVLGPLARFPPSPAPLFLNLPFSLNWGRSVSFSSFNIPIFPLSFAMAVRWRAWSGLEEAQRGLREGPQQGSKRVPGGPQGRL